MNVLFIIHEPHLTDEYELPTKRKNIYEHWVGPTTKDRIKTLSDVLLSLGKYVRLNNTVWCLKTVHEPSDVLERIKLSWTKYGNLDAAGDILVIEAHSLVIQSNQISGDALSALAKDTFSISRQAPAQSHSLDNSKPVLEPDASHKYAAPYSHDIADNYDIKETDAMLRRVHGCYGMGKKR